MKTTKQHIETLKQMSKHLEEGRIKPFRSAVVAHYFESLNTAIKGMNELIQKLSKEERISNDILAAYKELEQFYNEKAIEHKMKRDWD